MLLSSGKNARGLWRQPRAVRADREGERTRQALRGIKRMLAKGVVS